MAVEYHELTLEWAEYLSTDKAEVTAAFCSCGDYDNAHEFGTITEVIREFRKHLPSKGRTK